MRRDLFRWLADIFRLEPRRPIPHLCNAFGHLYRTRQVGVWTDNGYRCHPLMRGVCVDCGAMSELEYHKGPCRVHEGAGPQDIAPKADAQ